MAPPRTRRDQLIRDLVREYPVFSEVEGYLKQHLGPEMGALNVKQTEGILILIQLMKKMMEALGAINMDMVTTEDALAIDESGKAPIQASHDEIIFKVGDASIRLVKDGSINIRGKDMRVTASGEATINASKDLILKGRRIREN